MIEEFRSNLSQWQYTVDGLTFRGWHSNPSGKPVIHFIHGNGYSALTYAPFLSRLSEKYDLFLTNAQGHGGSDSGTSFLGWNENAELLAEVWCNFDKLWYNVPHIAMGHSFGGVLSSLIVGNNNHRFSQLVMLDPVLFLPHMITAMTMAELFKLGPIGKLPEKTRKRKQVWSDSKEAYDHLHGKGMFLNWTSSSLESYVEDATFINPKGMRELKCSPAIESKIFGSHPRKMWSTIRSIDVPITMLYGDKTYDFVQKASKKLKRIHRGSRILKLNGGHCFMQENYRKSAALCIDEIESQLKKTCR